MASNFQRNAIKIALTVAACDPRLLLSLTRVGAVLHCSRSSTDRVIRSGDLPHVPWGADKRVKVGTLCKFVDELPERHGGEAK